MTAHQDMVALLDILNSVIQNQAQDLVQLQEDNSGLHTSLSANQQEVARLQDRLEDESDNPRIIDSLREKIRGLETQVWEKNFQPSQSTPITYYLANPRKLREALHYMMNAGEQLDPRNDKTRLIKHVREASSVGQKPCWGLKESKDFVEAYVRGSFQVSDVPSLPVDLGADYYDPTDDMPTDCVPKG